MANYFEKYGKAQADQEAEQDNPFAKYGRAPGVAEHTQSMRAKPVQPSGGILDFLGGIGSGFADLGRGAQQRYAEITSAPNKDELYAAEAARRERREFDPTVTQAEKLGRGFGLVGGTLPFAFIPGGKSALGSTITSLFTGGAAGSLLPTTSGSEAAANAGLGAAGQALGNLGAYAVLPTTARNLTQAQKDILTAARSEKIPLRTSEATGSNVIRNWEQMRANRPITGGMEQRFNEEQTAAINRAITRRLGNEMSEVNDASLLKFRNDIGGEVSGMMKGRTVPLDTDFFNAVVAVDADSSVGGRLTSSPALRTKIEEALDLIGNKQSVSGETAQRIRSKLMDQARDARANENTELANGLEDLVAGLKKAMDGTLSASERKAWQEANRRYANYKLIEESFIKDPRSLAEGDVPINKLARVMEQNRPRSYVHGTGDFSGIAKLGQVIKPPGRSALLAESSLPIARNAMDVVSGAAYPVIESQLMQRYLTGGFPIQRTLRDTPFVVPINDALLRAAGITNMLGEEKFK